MIDLDDIKSITKANYYSRGRSYFREGRVKSVEETEPGKFSFVVSGSRNYHGMFELDQGGVVQGFACDCPLGESMPYYACKHVIAALLHYHAQAREEAAYKGTGARTEELHSQAGKSRQEMLSSDYYDDLPYPKELLTVETTREERLQLAAEGKSYREYAEQKLGRQKLLFQGYEHAPLPVGEPDRIFLKPRLFVEEHYGSVTRWLEFYVGKTRPYVLRRLLEFLMESRAGGTWPLGKKDQINFANFTWQDERSAALFALVKDVRSREREALSQYAQGTYGYGYGYQTYSFEEKRMYLGREEFARFLAIMGGEPFELSIDGGEKEEVSYREGDPPIKLSLEAKPGGAVLSVAQESTLCTLDENFAFIYMNGEVYAASEAFIQNAAPLLKEFKPSGLMRLTGENLTRFFSLVLPRLEGLIEVQTDEKIAQRFISEPLSAELYLDYEGDGIAARPVLRYGNVSFNPLLAERPELPQGLSLVRNESGERDLMARFLTYGFEAKNGRFVQLDEEKSFEFLEDELPNLPEWVEVFYEDAFASKPVRQMPKVSAGVSVNDENLLEVSFNAQDLNIEELLAILASYRKKRRYHRLKDRTFVTLGEQQLSALADFVESTGLTEKRVQEDGRAVLPLTEALYLDTLAREEGSDIALKRAKSFKALVRKIKSPEAEDYQVPERLEGVLRDYQVTGFNWLMGLASAGFGGILADDMGLGKTLEVLTFLLAQREEGALPSLVVAPTSLMYNWLEEAERFTPELKAVVVAGTKAEREKALQTAMLDGTDLVITTYNMLKRDLDLYSKECFKYAILDEAQHIKNPVTQNAKAVKSIRARGYFALTGTPIENTLTELWSIFDYLMPGYLQSHAKFKEKYETPIVRAEDKRAGTDLRRRIMPFILRRLKKDVLTELPDKVERRLSCEMTPKQEKVYKAWFIKSQKEFQETLKAHGLGESKIKILAILTRLRQIACDPALFLEDYQGGSGKLDMIEEIVTDAAGAGHRLLIFSQFTTMLGHIGERLKSLGLTYYYLDGSTPPRERMGLVKSFNAGAAPVFLISLKAGGTGLNLTGADMVMHVDPWWNPAVEDQATDRAYRLGQKRNVQVIKLVTRHTIEEKIYALQQKKKDLIDKMIQPGESFLSRLTDEEIQALFKA